MEEECELTTARHWWKSPRWEETTFQAQVLDKGPESGSCSQMATFIPAGNGWPVAAEELIKENVTTSIRINFPLLQFGSSRSLNSLPMVLPLPDKGMAVPPTTGANGLKMHFSKSVPTADLIMSHDVWITPSNPIAWRSFQPP